MGDIAANRIARQYAKSGQLDAASPDPNTIKASSASPVTEKGNINGMSLKHVPEGTPTGLTTGPIDSQHVVGSSSEHRPEITLVQRNSHIEPPVVEEMSEENEDINDIWRDVPDQPTQGIDNIKGTPQVPDFKLMKDFNFWYATTKELKEFASVTDKLLFLAKDKRVFTDGLFFALSWYCYHLNQQSEEIEKDKSSASKEKPLSTSISSPHNSKFAAIENEASSNEVTSFRKGSIAGQQKDLTLTKKEQLQEGLANIKALFDAVKIRAAHFEREHLKKEDSSNQQEGIQEPPSSNSIFSFFSFFTTPPPQQKIPTLNNTDVEKEFIDFYRAENMDFEVAFTAVYTQCNVTLNEQKFNALREEYTRLTDDSSIGSGILDSLQQAKDQTQEILADFQGKKNKAFSVLPSSFAALNVKAGNNDLNEIGQKTQLLLLIMGMSKLKSGYELAAKAQRANVVRNKIIKDNPSVLRKTLISTLSDPSFKNKDSYYVLLNDDDKFVTNEQYKKPSYSIVSFFYSLFRGHDDSAKYKRSIEKARDLVHNDYGFQAAERFVIQFGSRYRSGSPLTFGALNKFLEQERALANGQEYALQASSSKNPDGFMWLLRDEFEKAYPTVKQRNLSAEDKGVLLDKFFKDHEKFIVVPEDNKKRANAAALGQKDWWLWPSQPNPKEANLASFWLLFPELENLITINTAGTYFVKGARENLLNTEFAPYLNQDHYLSVRDIGIMYSKALLASKKNYEGLYGTFESFCAVGLPLLEQVTPFMQGAAAAKAFSEGKTVIQGVGNAAAVSALFAALPEDGGLRAVVSALYAIFG